MNILRVWLAVVILFAATSVPAAALSVRTVTKLVIPKVDFREATLEEAVEFLRFKAKGQNPEGDTLNIVIAIPQKPRPRISLQRENGTLGDLLKETAAQAGCEVQTEPYALVIREKGAGPLPPIRAGEGVDLPKMTAKLGAIILPRIDFREATVREGFEFLVQKTKQLDPEGGGFNVVLELDDQGGAGADAPPPPAIPGLEPEPGTAQPPVPQIPGLPPAGLPGVPQTPRVTFQASQMPILEVMRYIAGVAGLQITIERFGIVITRPR